MSSPPIRFSNYPVARCRLLVTLALFPFSLKVGCLGAAVLVPKPPADVAVKAACREPAHAYVAA